MKHTSYRLLVLVMVVSMILVAVMPAAANQRETGVAQSQKSNNGVYIVQMSDAPVVAYTGDINGYKATQPNKDQKIDPTSAVVINYVGYLDSKHTEALNRVGGGHKLYDYRYSFNGFAAQLTPDQAVKMSSVPGVLAVSADEIQTMDTSSTPHFLGLDAPGGLWDQLGGVGKAGDGIIIGDIDSGIWPES